MPGLTQSNTSTGARESLSDTLFEYNAQETPLYSMLKKTTGGGNPVEQWPADTEGVSTGRGKKDNTPTPATTNQSDNYGLLEALYHWWEDAVSVGKKAEALVNRAGVSKRKLFARELTKVFAAQKTRIDRNLGDDTDQREEGSEGSETRGIGSWISSNAQGTRPVPEKFRPPAGAIQNPAFADIREETFEDILEALHYETGTTPRYTGLFGMALKRLVSSWSAYAPDKASHSVVRQFNSDRKTRALTKVIDLLEYSEGTIEIHTSRNLGWSRDFTKNTAMSTASKRRGYILTLEDFELKTAQKQQYTPLPPDGGGKRGQIDALMSLCGTPKRSGKIVPS
ncbi:MAG: DUF5309 family protein [Verrucomicrobiota bacterium]